MDRQPPRNELFAALVVPVMEDLRLRARQYHPAPADAADLLQDTLERALRRLDTLRPDSNPRAWLYTIMFHLFVDQCRRRRIQQEVLPDNLPAPEPEACPPWQELDAGHVDAALAGMEGPFRQVLELRWRDRCSYQEISTRLRIPLATVGTRLLRGHRRLRVALDRAA
jgi:RNA polymerase sigma-70 factor (ECF subfamily)